MSKIKTNREQKIAYSDRVHIGHRGESKHVDYFVLDCTRYVTIEQFMNEYADWFQPDLLKSVQLVIDWILVQRNISADFIDEFALLSLSCKNDKKKKKICSLIEEALRKVAMIDLCVLFALWTGLITLKNLQIDESRKHLTYDELNKQYHEIDETLYGFDPTRKPTKLIYFHRKFKLINTMNFVKAESCILPALLCPQSAMILCSKYLDIYAEIHDRFDKWEFHGYSCEEELEGSLSAWYRYYTVPRYTPLVQKKASTAMDVNRAGYKRRVKNDLDPRAIRLMYNCGRPALVVFGQKYNLGIEFAHMRINKLSLHRIRFGLETCFAIRYAISLILNFERMHYWTKTFKNDSNHAHAKFSGVVDRIEMLFTKLLTLHDFAIPSNRLVFKVKRAEARHLLKQAAQIEVMRCSLVKKNPQWTVMDTIQLKEYISYIRKKEPQRVVGQELLEELSSHFLDKFKSSVIWNKLCEHGLLLPSSKLKQTSNERKIKVKSKSNQSQIKD